MFAVIVPIGIGGIVFFGLWFWAVLDCIATDSILVRNLPKQTWIFIVVFVPTVGAMAWLLLGRPEGAGFAVGGNYRPRDYTGESRGRAVEDTVDWQHRKQEIKPAMPATDDGAESSAVRERRLLEWEAELKKREAALGDEDEPSS